MTALILKLRLVFCALVTLMLASLACPFALAAEPAAEADAAISKGVELRRQGKNEEALDQFQKAYRLAPTPRAKAQIALAEQAIGRWADAERDLGEALNNAADPWIARQRPVLSEAMNVIRRHLGGLTVKGEPAGAVVELDGEAVGVIPLPERHVTAGEVVVTVRAPGFVSVTRKVQVTPGELAAEIFRLKRVDSDGWGRAVAPARAGGVEPSATTQVGLPAVNQSGPQPTDQPATPVGNHRLRTAAWATAIGAGVALAAGGTFLLLGESKANTFQNDNTCDFSDSGAVTGGSHCQDLYNAWHTNRTVGIVGLAVGGALAATSAVLFVKTQSSAAGASSTQALATCGPGPGAGVGCAWRF